MNKFKYLSIMKIALFYVNWWINRSSWSPVDAAKPHHPVLKSVTQEVLLYGLIWQNWWHDQDRRGEEVVSKLRLTGQESPCFRLIPSWHDFPVTLAACVFHQSVPGVFPGLQPPGDAGPRAGGQRATLSLASPPILPRHSTGLSRWQKGDFFNTLVGSATVAPSVTSISPCISLWPFPSFHQQENK